jgi:general secretion pathway protein D
MEASMPVCTFVGLAVGLLIAVQAHTAHPPQVATVPIQLKHISATRTAKKLTARLGQERAVTILADEESNTVFIRASADNVQQAKKIIRQLDVWRSTCSFIIPLKHADASTTATALQAILALAALLGDESDVHVTADQRANSLVIAASEEAVQKLKLILRQLDEEK